MFDSARLKLTAWYLLIIMIISGAFSGVIYKVLTNELDRLSRAQNVRFERAIKQGNIVLFRDGNGPVPGLPPMVDPDLVKETKQRVILALLIVDASILILAGGLAYMLAGRTLRPIKEMVEEQNRFITDSSHELRTPLTSLKTAMEVSLRDKRLTLAEAKTILFESIEEVNKLQLLSDQLLLLAQYQKPRTVVNWEKIKVADVVQKAVRLVNPLAHRKQITITTELEDVAITTNQHALQELLVILLDNAIKYSPSLTQIGLTAHQTDGKLKLLVQDQGVGITAADLPHIFDRFYRVSPSRSQTETRGYGLGLSIAKKIVANLNGTITVQSQSHRGSTFTITLPRRPTTKLV